MVVGNIESPEFQEFVVPALVRLKEKSPEGCPWTVESVAEKIRSDEWILILLPDSFVIMQEDGEYLHAAIAAAYDGVTENFFEYTEMIGEMAKSAGYQGFTFTTCRNGWFKLAKEVGFRIREVTFVYE